MKRRYCKIVWRNGVTSEFDGATSWIGGAFEIDINAMGARLGTEPYCVTFYMTAAASPAAEDEVGTIYFYKEGEN